MYINCHTIQMLIIFYTIGVATSNVVWYSFGHDVILINRYALNHSFNVSYYMLAKSMQHPRGLYLLCFVELWERFGFYTVQTILILYMTKALGMDDSQANLHYAAFGSLVYLTPVIGGYLADKYLGAQRSILIGGLMFIAAYLICAFPGKAIFFLGLSILICANGLFKPNVSTLVGSLYQTNDPRRDGGFTLFYMGINIGALIPPLLAGGLVARYGWHSGFILAAIGMAIGQLTYMLGRPNLHEVMSPLKPAKVNVKFLLAFIAGTLASIFIFFEIFEHAAWINSIMAVSGVGIVIAVIYFLLKEPAENQKKLIACSILILISLAFWSLYNQGFTSLMLFADRNLDQHFLGMPLDAEATQFFNPFFIIVLSPLLSRFWIRMDNRGLNPSTQMKFFLGIVFMALGFLMLMVASNYLGTDGKVSSWYLCGSYFLQTIGELLISPIGLAMITVLCPPNLVGMMMGVWFFSQAAAFTIGGVFANIAAVPAHVSAVESLSIYGHAFGIYSLIALAMAAISLVLVPLLNKITAE